MTSYSPKLLITGGNGQVAQALLHHPAARAFNIHAPSHQDVDITDTASVVKIIDDFKPDWIINTAAFTAVDKAESDQAAAQKANAEGPAVLAKVCAQVNLPLLHLSTDYIFDGKSATPYHETDQANPANFYGLSKWQGEEAIRLTHDQHLILRVSGVFSEYGNNFLKTILRLAKEKKSLRIVADQITCPTSANDIASAIFAIVQQTPVYGTYHYCSTHAVSWYEFATAIISKANPKDMTLEEILAIPTSDYPTAAIRPAYSVLACEKILADYGITQPLWEKAIESVISNLERS